MNLVSANVLSGLVLVALLGLLAMTLVMCTQSVLALRTRAIRDALAAILFRVRKPDADEDVTDDELARYCRIDTDIVIAHYRKLSPGREERFSRTFADTLGKLDRAIVSKAIRTKLADVRSRASHIANELGEAEPAIRTRFVRQRHAITLGWSFGVAFALYWTPTFFGSNEPTVLSLFYALFPNAVSDTSAAASIALSTAIITIAASLLYSRFDDGEALIGDDRLDDFQPEEERGPEIGRAGCAVRVVNFAGGGFDSIMQLGVIHALMAIQGRPPDAVVGLSTGAIPAAALAEVMQAGESEEEKFAGTPWAEMPAEAQLELQTKRMKARVQRFRSFENAAYEARERLYDALTPDAYQVESTEPLAPLTTPFFQTQERKDKFASLATQSGLLRLYNDLLKINIPFGTITRVIRRVLGFLASGEIPNRGVRYANRILEFNRVWLLIGSNVRGVSRLLPVLIRPIFRSRFKVRPMSAGSLIFRFPINRILLPTIGSSLSHIALIAFWLGGSIVPLIPFLFVVTRTESQLAYLLLATYLVLLGVGFLATYQFDASTIGGAVRDNLRGVAQYAWLVIKLSAVLIAAMFVLTLLLDPPAFVERWISALFFADGVSPIAPDGAAGIETRTMLWTALAIAAGTVLNVALFAAVGVGYVYTRVSAVWRNVRTPFSFGSWYVQQFLKSYNIEKSLFNPYELRSYLTEILNEEYYGRTDLNAVISDSLCQRKTRSVTLKPNVKRAADYRDESHTTPIHVGIAAANVLTGDLETIPANAPLIDSIEAAMALAPLYPAKRIRENETVYVNGSNIANVPTRATSTFLRGRINRKSGAVHLYSVSPFPLSQSGLEDTEHGMRPYVHLWNIVKRALHLQRHRDARLEQKLTEFYTHVIPEKGEDNEIRNQLHVPGSGPGTFTRVWVTPIESSQPLEVNKRILLASRYQQRTVVAQTIADGCRASLEMMIRPAIREIAKDGKARCLLAVQRHLDNQKESAALSKKVRSMSLPGSSRRFGPGLREICERCALNRDPDGKGTSGSQGYLRLNKTLTVERPAWPHERAVDDGDLHDDESVRREVALFQEKLKQQYGRIDNWPLRREFTDFADVPKCESRKGNERATISLLFSGGVFRGVFQMGVLNALNELRIRPDVIAGASIGSITAAMVARVFAMPEDQGEQRSAERLRQIARLSAVYLAVDRLILTDRFADFVRNLTIRASQIDFSMRQADYFFRRYDYPRSAQFDRLARKVLAGLERMFYVNPYQLNDLVKSLRNEDDEESVALARTYTQQWLRRMGVSVETLGAEPLEQLIEHFVIAEKPAEGTKDIPFSVFSDDGMQLLATATNLQRGKLEIIGEPPDDPDEVGKEELLMEALLVSSAFPGVFRPRWSWDLRPGTTKKAQYIDGGVLDNLPIEPVFDFLNGAQAVDRIDARPKNINGKEAPHLMFAASLEVSTPQLRYRDQWRLFEEYWPALLSRTKELRYNTKADIYDKAQKHLRDIYESALRSIDERDELDVLDDRQQPTIMPMDVEVVTVKPKWLCGTFGFHPMLGFRRDKQARNIAHGCAATLLRFANVEEEHLIGWNINPDLVPKSKTFGEAHIAWKAAKKARKRKDNKDKCWLRPDHPCPYAADNLKALNRRFDKKDPASQIDAHTLKELANIHEYCRQRKTHRPK